jgi:hypothetical protein
MIGTKGRVALTAVCVMTLNAASARAQAWGTNGYGVAEADTKQTLLLLAGLSVSPGGRGWSPLVSLQGYYLTYDAGNSRTNETVIKPAIGVHNGFENGGASFTVGYAFSNRDNNTGGPVVAAERGRGVVVSADVDLNPRTSAWDFQGLSSYNFGSQSFWGRARTTTRLGSGSGTATRIGPEVAYLTGTGYWAWQPGLVMTWMTQSGHSVGLGAGAKFANGTNNNAAYFRLEFGLPLFR